MICGGAFVRLGKQLLQKPGTFAPKHLDGSFLGALIGATFIIFINSGISSEYKKYWTYGISALVSLFASGVALTGVLASISNQNRKFFEERVASHKAAKALLPIALSRFHEVSENATSIALRDDTFFENSENVSTIAEAVEIGDETIRVLKECIEYSDEVTQEWLSIAFARYQVARSRLISSVADPHRVVTDLTRGDHAFDWEVIRAIVSHLFSFARGHEGVPSSQIDPETVTMSMLHPEVGKPRYTAAQQRIIERRKLLSDGSLKDFRENI
ncbi:hypothetical protein [Phaeobacter inhibens]|uniref:hypothetical protein n=1 Tax=Phaeobacter inhibens TaxID=221822 RepID=UPI00076BB20F|nr:hypothetical protein [Phaeobacter inhibens]KXF91196.1 hypothetical protein AT574_08135 [Phaeobacter inhibens]WHP67441.1 hypothetical protein QMZ01_12925 [Phaeobacter inhibens]